MGASGAQARRDDHAAVGALDRVRVIPWHRAKVGVRLVVTATPQWVGSGYAVGALDRIRV